MSRPDTPVVILGSLETDSGNVLPEKSRVRYELVYQTFKEWCKEKEASQYSESDILEYFKELSKVKKASTLWATYSMLKKTLYVNEKVDISKSTKLQLFLRKQNVGYQPKKSSIFSAIDVSNFLENAPNDLLPIKVALIIGITGSCGSDELCKMKRSDIDILENRVSVVLSIANPYQAQKSFVITNRQWINIIKHYVTLRDDAECNRFFLQMRNGKVINQPFGHNTIGQFPQRIATFLKLPNPKSYTGHCFRRTGKLKKFVLHLAHYNDPHFSDNAIPTNSFVAVKEPVAIKENLERNKDLIIHRRERTIIKDEVDLRVYTDEPDLVYPVKKEIVTEDVNEYEEVTCSSPTVSQPVVEQTQQRPVKRRRILPKNASFGSNRHLLQELRALRMKLRKLEARKKYQKQQINTNETNETENELLVPEQCETDEFDKTAATWAVELRKMRPDQQLFAKKAVNDILFEGQMGTLNRNSVQINCFTTTAPLSAMQLQALKEESSDVDQNVVFI